MATNPRYTASGFGGPISVTATGGKRDNSSGTPTTIASVSSTQTGLCTGAEIFCVSATCGPDTILFFHNDNSAGTTTLVGELVITQTISPTNQTSGFIGVWRPISGQGIEMDASDAVKVIQMNGSATLHVRALGGIF